jgi:hypothetical protein
MTAKLKLNFHRWSGPILAGTAFCLVVAQPALASTRTTVVVTGGAKVETAPFQDAGAPPVGVAASIGVAPTVRFDSGKTRIRLFGSARVDQYVEHYGNDIAGSVGLAGTTQLSSRTSMYGSSSFSSSQRSYRDRLQSLPEPAVEPDLIIPDDALLPDPSLIGRRVRNNQFSAAGGVSHVISSRDTVSLGTNYAKGWTDNSSGGRDFQTYGGSLSYSRRLSSATSVGLAFSAAKYDYSGGSLGDSTVYSPSLRLNTRLGGRWTLAASGGASIMRQTVAPGVSNTTTSFSGSLSLCERNSRSGFCLTASQAVQPTFLGESRATTQFAATYSRRVNQNDNLSLSAGYGRTGNSLQSGLRGQALDTFGGSARYSHRFSRRVNGLAGISYDTVLRSVVPRKDNFTFNLGVSYVLGDVQ